MRYILIFAAALLLSAAPAKRSDGTRSCMLEKLSVIPPERFRLLSTSTEESPSPIPGNEPTKEILCSYADMKDKRIYLLIRRGNFPRDRGPVSTLWKHRAAVGSHNCEVFGADIFMDTHQNVTAAYCRLPKQYDLTIHSPDLSAEDFLKFLKEISLRYETR